jgi:dTDP-4-dehydrorhamnose reductase
MTILLTGGSGALGSEIKKQFPDIIAPISEDLNIKNRDQVLDFVKKNKINQIIHTAAIASVRTCDEQRQEAWQTNVEGTRNLVDALKLQDQSGYFIYVSTACVFRGDEQMYTEESVPYPVNFYALTKLIGETIVQSLSNHLIIRTNFVGKKKWPYKKAFTDRFGTYLFAEDVAKGIKEMHDSHQKGILHLAGDRIISMYELAKITTPEIEPMSINDYSGPHLTINMSLDSKRWKKYKIS